MRRAHVHKILARRGWLAEIDPALRAAVFDAGRVIAFRRGRFVAVTNLSEAPVDLPAGARIRLASAPVEGGRLPADASAWLDLA